MGIRSGLLCLAVALVGGILPSTATAIERICCPREAPPLVQYAAQELRRYIYLRTGGNPAEITDECDSAAIILATQESAPEFLKAKVAGLTADACLLETRDTAGSRQLFVIGGSPLGVLYGVYRFCEHLGIRFYLHGDVVPDDPVPFALPDIHEQRAPLFALRGIQPFHDFPEGPDWWNTQDYEAIIAQLPKLGMNFFGLHTYPEDRPNAEPTVWIGRPEDLDSEGGITAAYPASYYNTALNASWGFEPKATSSYSCGASLLFDRDDYGSEVMRGLTPKPDTPEEMLEVFDRAGALLSSAFCLARELGVKTCIGTEAPLIVPKLVQERAWADPELKRRLYEGMFTRIMKTHPLDFYWFWTPEGWTWEGVKEDAVEATIADMLAAREAAQAVGAPFRLATCGWVLGPQYDRAFLDKALPKDIALSCISRAVGHDPVEPGFAAISGRDKWAIPWLEDDPAMSSVQLWAGRMLRDAQDALKYGCTGLMGIHWRTHAVAPNIAALAQAAWVQPEITSPPATGVLGGRVAEFAGVDFADTEDDTLYQTVRYDLDGYKFALPEGTYRVSVLLCEPYYAESGKRVFGLKLESKTVLEHLDLFREAGRNRALMRHFDEVAVHDGQLDIDFVHELEFPCIAALVVEGEGIVRKINCGGPAWKDFEADLAALPLHPPALDFYQDWAGAEFGPKAGPAAATILARMDGRLPRPSDWIGGPGGYRPDTRAWETVRGEYDFVDEFAALRAGIKGAGNLARFDYWRAQFEFLRATANMQCVWAEFEAALKTAQAAAGPAAVKEKAGEAALPAYGRLVQAASTAYGWLLQAVDTPGELGTVCNFEQHTLPHLLGETRAKLELLLGEPLPPELDLADAYQGPARLIVPTKGGYLAPGNPLRISALVLSVSAPKEVRLVLRAAGAGGSRSYLLKHARGGVYSLEIAAGELPGDCVEYQIEAILTSNEVLRWPAGRGHTVVIANLT